MPTLEIQDPTGCILDGCIPRTNATRVADLLDEAEALLNQTTFENSELTLSVSLWDRYYNLLHESKTHDEDHEFWNEIEDDVIDLINDLLPQEYICELHPAESGTVGIWLAEEDDDHE